MQLFHDLVNLSVQYNPEAEIKSVSLGNDSFPVLLATGKVS